MQDGKTDDVRATVLALLGERGGQARFVPELIAALARADAVGADPQAAAVEKIETCWQRWLGEYLATHRCT